MFQDLGARLMALVGRGRVQLSDVSGPAQVVQVDQGRHQGLIDKVPLYQHFGLASRPPVGTDVVVLYTNGDLANGTAIASNSQDHRPPALEEGDAALHDVRGAYVWLSVDGLQVEAKNMAVVVRNATTVTVIATEKVRLETPNLEVTGDIVDHCDDGTPTLKTLRDDYNAHHHTLVKAGTEISGPTDHLAE